MTFNSSAASHEFDVAVSFAGEDRSLVEAAAQRGAAAKQ
jgi:hypothetical protein